MRNIYKKAASLLLVTMILLSMVVTGAVAEAAAPTEVKSCEKSGFYTTVLNFEFSDTTWLDAVNGVTVNGTAFTGQTISSFSNDTGIFGVSVMQRVHTAAIKPYSLPLRTTLRSR